MSSGNAFAKIEQLWKRNNHAVSVDTDDDKEFLKKEAVMSGEVPPWTVRGTRLAPWGVGGSRAADVTPLVAGAQTTTPNAEVLTAAVVRRPTGDAGTLIGRDVMTHALVAHDPFSAYAAKTISSPAVLVLGDVGSGKSSLLKTCYVLRPLIHFGKRVVVIDKKDEGGEGEYANLTRRFNVEPIRFRLDGAGSVLNPLDPAITGAERHGGARVLRALTEIAGERSLVEWENKALRMAYAETMNKYEDKKRAPVLNDILDSLDALMKLPEAKKLGPSPAARLEEASMTVRFMLDRLVDEYPGLFDQETSKNVTLQSKLTTFDVSQLPSAGPAVPAVVGLANAWLLGKLRHDRGKATNLVVEEGWHLLEGPNANEWKEKVKLARSLALSLVMAIHKPADIDPHSPAMTIVQEAATVHLYRNTRMEDAVRCREIFDLHEGSEEVLMTLPTGHHLLKIGNNAETWIQHVRSELEEVLTDTDSAMLASESRMMVDSDG